MVCSAWASARAFAADGLEAGAPAATPPRKGYWVVHVTIRDPAAYPAYLAADKIAFDKFGARFLVRGGAYEAAEGQARERHVVIEFASYEIAKACYHSAEYQAAARLRQAAADAEVLILEGME